MITLNNNGVGFDKVIKMIDNMVALLGKMQAVHSASVPAHPPVVRHHAPVESPWPKATGRPRKHAEGLQTGCFAYPHGKPYMLPRTSSAYRRTATPKTRALTRRTRKT